MLAVLIIAVLPFAALTAFSYPSNDDWGTAMSVARRGVLGNTTYLWRTWSGRYTGTLAASLDPIGWGSFAGHRMLLLGYIALLAGAAMALVAALAPRCARLRGCAAVALGFLALHLQGMPDPATGIYWLNGVSCYVLGEVLLLCAIACVVMAERPGGARSWLWTALAAPLVAGAAGTNEIVMLLLDGFLLGAVAVLVAKGRPPWRVVSLLLIALGGTFAVVLAPGTRARLAIQGTAGADLAETVAAAAEAAVRHAMGWTLSPLLPGALLLAMAAARAAAAEDRWSLPHPTRAAAPALAAYTLASFVPYLTTGKMERHTQNLAHAVFVGGAHFVAAAAGARMGRRRPTLAAIPAVVRPAFLAAALGLAFLPGSNLRAAWFDLISGRATRYDADMRARYALILRCPADCTLPPLQDAPRLLHWFEDAEGPREIPFFQRYKTSYAKYFGRHRIRLGTERIPQPAPGSPAS
jgi:hypothetical protein